MTAVTADDIRFLAREHPPLCVSLFVPITPGRRADADVQIRNQLARAKELLSAVTDPASAERLLAPAHRLREEVARVPVRGQGLAHFACPAADRTFSLEAAPAALAVVGSVFHIRPVLEEGEPGHYFLLALSHRAAKLYRGTRHGLEPILVPQMPDGLEDALRNHDSDEPLTLHSFRRGRTAEAVFHGHGVGIDDRKDDLVSYFRVIDRAIHPILCQEAVPLVLAGVTYLLPLYARANAYPHLHASAVPGNPDHSSADDLHRAAWPLVATHCRESADRAIRQFHQLHGTGRTVISATEIAETASAGALGTLLISPPAMAWPTEVVGAGDELYNMAAVHVLRHGGDVHRVDSSALGGPHAAGIRWLPRDHH